MPSQLKTVTYRPDNAEEVILDALTQKYGVTRSGAISLALRQQAERDNIPIPAIERPKRGRKPKTEDKDGDQTEGTSADE